MTFLGWFVGVALALLLGTAGLPWWVAALLIVLSYLGSYSIASKSLAPSLPTTRFPLARPFSTPMPVVLRSGTGELFARGELFGMTAALNALLLLLVPVAGSFLACWAFLVISLAVLPGVAKSRLYHGFLGWSAWLFPMSYLATLVGLLLFIINLLPAFAAGGIGAVRLDVTTGVIETSGGIIGITGFVGGFSLGNFTFISPSATFTRGPFTAPSVSSHETGHSLNTAAMSGVVLWINGVDENLRPFAKFNLAYGELCAESHAQAQPGTLQNDYSIALWS